MKRRTAMCLAVIAIALYLLTGCAETRVQKQTQTDRSGSAHIAGQVNGLPVDVVIDFNSQTNGKAQELRQVNVTVPPALGGVAQLVALLTTGGGLGAVGLLIRNLMAQANTHKENENEAWDLLLKAKDEAAKP